MALLLLVDCQNQNIFGKNYDIKFFELDINQLERGNKYILFLLHTIE